MLVLFSMPPRLKCWLALGKEMLAKGTFRMKEDKLRWQPCFASSYLCSLIGRKKRQKSSECKSSKWETICGKCKFSRKHFWYILLTDFFGNPLSIVECMSWKDMWAENIDLGLSFRCEYYFGKLYSEDIYVTLIDSLPIQVHPHEKRKEGWVCLDPHCINPSQKHLCSYLRYSTAKYRKRCNVSCKEQILCVFCQQQCYLSVTLWSAWFVTQSLLRDFCPWWKGRSCAYWSVNLWSLNLDILVFYTFFFYHQDKEIVQIYWSFNVCVSIIMFASHNIGWSDEIREFDLFHRTKFG